MNAAVVTTFEAPPRYTTFADPVPADSEKLVTVTAAGLHPLVRSLSSGAHYGSGGHLPFVAGVDGVGRLEDGARVYFSLPRAPFGTFSELSLAGPAMCIPLPDGLDDVTAAGSANPAMSSWVALTARAKFDVGESVLILGATGAAGQFAVQVAKRLGARRVVACGRNPHALEKLRDLGADATIPLDQHHEALVSAFRRERDHSGIDIVLDYLWGPPASAALEAIAQKGLSKTAPRVRYIQIGSMAGAAIPLPAATLRSSGLELLGSGFGSASLDQIRDAVTGFFAAAATTPFQTHIKAVPLRDVEALWNAPEPTARLVFQP
jgi:NADPH2:quinone reductase